jgi:hypothetical protein
MRSPPELRLGKIAAVVAANCYLTAHFAPTRGLDRRPRGWTSRNTSNSQAAKGPKLVRARGAAAFAAAALARSQSRGSLSPPGSATTNPTFC